jgi:hypothetical protein
MLVETITLYIIIFTVSFAIGAGMGRSPGHEAPIVLEQQDCETRWDAKESEKYQLRAMYEARRKDEEREKLFKPLKTRTPE